VLTTLKDFIKGLMMFLKKLKIGKILNVIIAASGKYDYKINPFQK
jgi:hypothetical protein